MFLSLAQRSSFYDELGKLFNAGFPLLKALETMIAARAGAGLRGMLQRLRDQARDGATLTEGISARGMPFERMEISLLAACEHSGQLPQGCQYLARYFARLAETRRTIWKRAAYPLFMLHFGVVTLALPKLFQEDQKFSLVHDILLPLAVFYVLGAIFWIMVRTLGTMAEESVLMEQILGLIPVLGGIRRSLALTRFCSGYLMQLDAGVNVMDSLVSAASASHSANLRAAIAEILPAIREGGQVGVELSGTRAFPQKLTRALLIGEQTGTLDQELTSAAAEYDAKAMNGIETLSQWIPKGIYLAIVLYLGWSIVSAYQASLGGLEKMLDSQ